MRVARIFTVSLSTLIWLLVLAVSVMARSDWATSQTNRPTAGEPQFTWQVTITVEAGGPLSATFNSNWSNHLISFPVGPGGLSFPIALPNDATQITASVTNGQVGIVGTTLHFTLTSSSDVFWAYRTGEKVVRSGNQLRIDQRTSSNNFYRQISTLEFPAPFQYVGTLTFTPQITTATTAQWDIIVPSSDDQRHVFQTTSWLADPALSQPDLSVQAASLSIDQSLNPPLAHLTTTVRNNSVNMQSNPAYVQFYSRLSPSTPPQTPIDHSGGWCGSGDAPVCPSVAGFTNPVLSIAPGQSLTLSTAYSLTDAGVRDFYLQVDTFGGPLGLNAESNENNNVYTIVTGVPVYYLASVDITGPVTGALNLPYAFTAQVTPATATSLPLTYTWSPTPDSGQGSAQAIYAWTTPTTKTITVTVKNPQNTVVTDTHFLYIGVPLNAVIVSGLTTVTQNAPHVFTALPNPSTATGPIGYAWSPEPVNGQSTSQASYAFADVGPQVITVTALSQYAPTRVDTHTINVVSPLASANITGPVVGLHNVAYAFSAAYSPAEAMRPTSYVWSPDPTNGQGTPQASYLWPAAGDKVISVTLSNDGGSVTGSFIITIDPERVFLPLVRKS